MKKKWFAVLGGVSLLALVGSFYYLTDKSDSLVSDFNDERDTQNVLKLMEDNWYWLISSPDYQADFMLRERAPSHKQPEYFGKLKIKVLRKDGQLVGFTAYYKKSEYQGHLLFLAVDEAFRRQGYAEQLFKYAIEDLKQMGAKWVRLVTREGNAKARSLYKKLGMQEYLIDDGFANFRLML